MASSLRGSLIQYNGQVIEMKRIGLLLGLLVMIILVSVIVSYAMSHGADSPPDTPSEDGMPNMCNQPYSLCDTAVCVPSQSDPTKVVCSCYNENGTSLGMNSCSARQPVGMYLNEDGEWMIKAGYPVGQITSTYSFFDAAPTEGGAIDPNTTPANYTGDIYLKFCKGGVWADCLDQPCTVLPEDPDANIAQDRKASNYSVCECKKVNNTAGYYMGARGDAGCENDTICHDYIWSAADPKTQKPGIAILTNYLKKNPDPSQPYAMGFCKDCAGCNATSI